MIRTKYLLITILICIGVILSGGVYMLQENAQTSRQRTQVSFATPQDTYHVVPNTNDGFQKDKNSFIEKVQNALQHKDVSPAFDGVKEDENRIQNASSTEEMSGIVTDHTSPTQATFEEIFESRDATISPDTIPVQESATSPVQ